MEKSPVPGSLRLLEDLQRRVRVRVGPARRRGESELGGGAGVLAWQKFYGEQFLVRLGIFAFKKEVKSKGIHLQNPRNTQKF